MWTMPSTRTRKTTFNKLGYGMLALYAAGIAAAALGVYGFNETGIFMGGDSERVRAKAQTGQMLIGAEDRVQCRSIRFNNETAQLSAETLTECSDRPGARSGGSFSVFRDGFVNR
jgi:hypothetical protein